MGSNRRIKERIKALFVLRNVSFTGYAEYMNENFGKKYSQSGLSHKLSRETISFKEVIEIAENLGYDVAFKPKLDWEGLGEK